MRLSLLLEGEYLMSTDNMRKDLWAQGDLYESYVGRWSRIVAREFIHWLAIPDNHRWLDVGCGTGALSQTVVEIANPQKLKGIDRSEGFLQFARQRVRHSQASFEAGDAQALPVEAETYDVAISGLVLNFVPEPSQMVAEMRRAVRQGGTVALYIWDYAGKMQMMRHLWNAAAALDPGALRLDEGRRFPLCNPEALAQLFEESGLSNVEARPIDIATDYRDFDDFWQPFLNGQGPAPGYVMSLSEQQRARLRERLFNSLPFAVDGSIPLVARAWAVRGVK
jgi:SAM-dependent methyltransferase